MIFFWAVRPNENRNIKKRDLTRSFIWQRYQTRKLLQFKKNIIFYRHLTDSRDRRENELYIKE